MKHDEYLLQRAVVKKLREQGIVVFAIPNERNMGISDSIRMRNAGLTKGAPDLICLKNYSRCIFLELKTKIGKQSPEQVAVADTLVGLGFEYRLVRSIEDIEDLI